MSLLGKFPLGREIKSVTPREPFHELMDTITSSSSPLFSSSCAFSFLLLIETELTSVNLV